MARVLICMPQAFLNYIDAFAVRADMTRSELVRSALRDYLGPENLKKFQDGETSP